MSEETREAMFYASKNNKLTRDKIITKTIQEPFTLEEVKAIMLDKSPTSIYVIPYSAKTPCFYITKRILPSDEGVFMYADSWIDKTPKHFSWERFYKELRSCGLETIRF